MAVLENADNATAISAHGTILNSEALDFIRAALRISESKDARYRTPANPFKHWLDGDLYAEWRAARLSGRRFYVSASETDGRALQLGREVIEHWAERSGLVHMNGVAATWLVDFIQEQFEDRPAYSPGWWKSPAIVDENQSPSPPLPDLPELIPFYDFAKKPSETEKQWKDKIIRVAKAERHARENVGKESRKSEPSRRKSGTYNEYAREALVLALCGVRWCEIFRRFRVVAGPVKGGKWRNDSNVRLAARLVAIRLNLKPPRVRAHQNSKNRA